MSEIAYQITIFRAPDEDGMAGFVQIGTTKEPPKVIRGWMLDAVERAHEIVCSQRGAMHAQTVEEFRTRERAVEAARGKMKVVDIGTMFRGPEPPREGSASIPPIEEASPFWEKPGRPVDQSDGAEGEDAVLDVLPEKEEE